MSALARNTDPETSRNAAKSVEDITDRQAWVLTVLKHVGPSTHDELCESYRAWGNIQGRPTQTEQSVRSRCSELVRLGKVEDSHARRKTVHGRHSIVWRAV